MRNVMSSQAQRNCYQAGREARSLDRDKSPPGGLGLQRRSYWLAGYNDLDIELQVKARNHREGQSKIIQEFAFGSTIEVFTSTRSQP